MHACQALTIFGHPTFKMAAESGLPKMSPKGAKVLLSYTAGRRYVHETEFAGTMVHACAAIPVRAGPTEWLVWRYQFAAKRENHLHDDAEQPEIQPVALAHTSVLTCRPMRQLWLPRMNRNQSSLGFIELWMACVVLHNRSSSIHNLQAV